MAQIFNTMQLEKTQTTVLPREVPTIIPTRVPITVPPPRVEVEVTPPRVMTTRSPIITHEDPIENNRHRDTLKHNTQHPLKHRYPTRITQMSQYINQVDSAAPAGTRNQNWLMNIYEQVKNTPQVVDNFLK